MEINDIFLETNARVFVHARWLRKKMTYTEKILWNILRNRNFNGFKFRRQFPLDNYIVDFCCMEKSLIIEIDGKYHELPDQKEYDKERNVIINELGFNIIRFTNDEVLNNLDFVLQKIKVFLNGHQPLPSPLRRRAGDEVIN